MSKHSRLETYVATLGADASLLTHPCYQGFFKCFNAGLYYEAHDVLEHLWLQVGRTDPEHGFYKGLIQLAGAFVHLQKHHTHPHHAKHGRRLRPAVRLFALATANLTAYGPCHFGLHVDQVISLCTEYTDAVVAGDFASNPWSPQNAPQLALAKTMP